MNNKWMPNESLAYLCLGQIECLEIWIDLMGSEVFDDNPIPIIVKLTDEE
jgi:hypothetical protein